MPFFRVLIRGSLGDGVALDDMHVQGLFVTRFAEGPDQNEAALNALAALVAEPQVQELTRLRAGQPPETSIEEIQAVSWTRATFAKKTGFIFFTDDDDSDEEVPRSRDGSP